MKYFLPLPLSIGANPLTGVLDLSYCVPFIYTICFLPYSLSFPLSILRK